MTATRHSALRIQGLTVYYGSVEALRNVSLEVCDNDIVALLGPNGAGKSTVLKAVSNLLNESGGTIRRGEIIFEGEDIRGIKTHDLVERGLVLVPEGRRVFSTMTVLENLEMGAYTVNDKAAVKAGLDSALNMFPQLSDKLSQQAGCLSTGEQQMLALGRALMRKPKLLLADEPSLGLSPNYVELIFRKLVEINKAGVSVLLVEQNAMMSLEICHRAYLFERGSIVVEGNRESLLKDDRVKTVFLGAPHS